MKLLHLTNLFPPFASGVAEKQCRLFVHELTARSHVNRVLTSDTTLPNIPDRDPHVTRKLRLSTPKGSKSIVRLLLDQRYNRRILIEELEELLPDLVVVWGMTGLSHTLLWEIERRGYRIVFAVLDPWLRHRLRDDSWYHWWYGPIPIDQKFFRRLLRETRLDRPIRQALPARRPTDMPIRYGFFASRALRDSVQLAGYEVHRCEVLPHALSREDIPGAPQRRDELRRLLWIGKLDTDHDPMTAVQTLQELRHQGEMRFSLDIFGRGDVAVEGRVRDYVRNAQLGGTVTIRQASVDEMAMLYSGYDVFLHTARHPDPFPIVILRAMAARLPVIAAPEGSVTDVVRNGDNALTFRTGDPPDCAEKILRLGANKALVERLTERAYREVLDNYSAVALASRLDRLLHEAARPRGE